MSPLSLHPLLPLPFLLFRPPLFPSSSSGAKGGRKQNDESRASAGARRALGGADSGHCAAIARSAGGGGSKSTHRKDKIRAKNAKLDQNRARRIEREKAAKGDAASGPPPAGDQPQGMGDSIHPSRLARNPCLGH